MYHTIIKSACYEMLIEASIAGSTLRYVNINFTEDMQKCNIAWAIESTVMVKRAA